MWRYSGIDRFDLDAFVPAPAVEGLSEQVMAEALPTRQLTWQPARGPRQRAR